MTHSKIDAARADWQRSQDAIITAKQLQAEAIADALAKVIRGIGALVERASAWQRRRRAYAELSDCNDRVLADIGLRRDQIREAVSGRLGRFEVTAANPDTYYTAPAVAGNEQTPGSRAA